MHTNNNTNKGIHIDRQTCAPRRRPRELILEAAGGVEGSRDREFSLVLVREVEKGLGRYDQRLGVGIVWWLVGLVIVVRGLWLLGVV